MAPKKQGNKQKDPSQEKRSRCSTCLSGEKQYAKERAAPVPNLTEDKVVPMSSPARIQTHADDLINKFIKNHVCFYLVVVFG
jgi:hypothetical protein